MTRKHFEAIAAGLAESRPTGHNRPNLANRDAKLISGQWIMTRDAIADAIGRFNPAFDRARFIKACGGVL